MLSVIAKMPEAGPSINYLFTEFGHGSTSVKSFVLDDHGIFLAQRKTPSVCGYAIHIFGDSQSSEKIMSETLIWPQMSLFSGLNKHKLKYNEQTMTTLNLTLFTADGTYLAAKEAKPIMKASRQTHRRVINTTAIHGGKLPLGIYATVHEANTAEIVSSPYKSKGKTNTPIKHAGRLLDIY